MAQQELVDLCKARGDAALAAGNNDEAVTCYSKAIEAAMALPQNERLKATLMTSRAHAFHMLGRYDDALADATWSVRHDPSCSEVCH